MFLMGEHLGEHGRFYSYAEQVIHNHPGIWHYKKSKAVPLHAMGALGGRGGVAPTHSRPRH
jgi:hypothetical protein